MVLRTVCFETSPGWEVGLLFLRTVACRSNTAVNSERYNLIKTTHTRTKYNLIKTNPSKDPFMVMDKFMNNLVKVNVHRRLTLFGIDGGRRKWLNTN